MTEDPIPGDRRNEPFSGLLAMVRRLEWAGVSAGGDATCPVCGSPEPAGDHLETCDLKSALDAATNHEHWPWCHCDGCECPNRIDPSHNSTLCSDCSRGLHFPNHEIRDA